jgi:beta-lactamase superfamily II metal-dependent hydrolase
MGAAPNIDPTRLKAAAPLNLAPDDLGVFFLNVGDGDSIVIRFPQEGGRQTFGVIDSFRGDKSVALINLLTSAQAPEPPRLRFVCATHPHLDHIAGLRKVMTTFKGRVDEFWDSGFRFTGTTYRNLIEEVEKQGREDRLRLLRPTSGLEFFHAGTSLMILSPSIALRNRYDTYGVDINNASIVMRLTYPVGKPSLQYPKTDGPPPAGDAAPSSTTVIFGGDAQSDAWGQVLQEFPHLDPDERQWARAIGAKNGRTPLKCDLFKVSHHCSKRGINLELIERLGDSATGFPSNGPPLLVSSCASGSDSEYGFPHAVTQDLLREVRDPQAKAGGTHPGDDALGIHYTAQGIGEPGAASTGPAGSLAYIMKATGSAKLYRMGDAVGDDVTLDARQVS